MGVPLSIVMVRRIRPAAASIYSALQYDFVKRIPLVVIARLDRAIR